MRIEDRPKKKFLSNSGRIALVLVGFWTAISIMFGFLMWAINDKVPDSEYGLHPEPIQTIYEAEVITEEVTFEQEAPLVSEDDLMARVIQAEAGSEPFIGKVAVAAVILNRSEMYGQTINDVLTKPNQFAVPSLKAEEDCYRAVEFARENRDLFPSNMIYFRNKHYHTKYGEPYTVIGGHYFSTEEGL